MILVKSISNQLQISWSQWQKLDNCNFVTERREEGKRFMNTEKQMKRMGVGAEGKTVTITVRCKCRGSQGGNGGNYVSVDFCPHSPLPFYRTKVNEAWLIIFKIL